VSGNFDKFERAGCRCTLELGRSMRSERRSSKAQPFAYTERNGRVLFEMPVGSRCPTRRDPCSVLPRSSVRETYKAGRSSVRETFTKEPKRSLRTFATGGSEITRRRSNVRDGLPVRIASCVAQLGVRAATRMTQIHGALGARNKGAYEVQETDGALHARARGLQSPSGTGAPTPSRRIGCGMQPTR
jgi:hypothetical protein